MVMAYYEVGDRYFTKPIYVLMGDALIYNFVVSMGLMEY